MVPLPSGPPFGTVITSHSPAIDAVAATAPSRVEQRGQPAVPAQRGGPVPEPSAGRPFGGTPLQHGAVVRAVVLSRDGEILGHRPPSAVAGLTRIMPQVGTPPAGGGGTRKVGSAVGVPTSVRGMPIRTASARWQGNLTEGAGTVRTGKGGLPGELLLQVALRGGRGDQSGGADRAPRTPAASRWRFSKELADAGFTPTSVETTAKVHLDKTDAGFSVTRIDLETVGDVPGHRRGTFQKIAEGAKEDCPISRLLSPGAQISLTARLA